MINSNVDKHFKVKIMFVVVFLQIGHNSVELIRNHSIPSISVFNVEIVFTKRDFTLLCFTHSVLQDESRLSTSKGDLMQIFKKSYPVLNRLRLGKKDDLARLAYDGKIRREIAHSTIANLFPLSFFGINFYISKCRLTL